MQEEYYDAQAEQYYQDEYGEDRKWDDPNGYWEVEEHDRASQHLRAETECSLTGTMREKLALMVTNLTTKIEDLQMQQDQQAPAEIVTDQTPTARPQEPPKTKTKPLPCSVEDIMIRAQELANEEAVKKNAKQTLPLDARGTSPPTKDTDPTPPRPQAALARPAPTREAVAQTPDQPAPTTPTNHSETVSLAVLIARKLNTAASPPPQTHRTPATTAPAETTAARTTKP